MEQRMRGDVDDPGLVGQVRANERRITDLEAWRIQKESTPDAPHLEGPPLESYENEAPPQDDGEEKDDLPF